jgi:hypothetical protein
VGKFGALPPEQHGEQDSAGTIIFLRMLIFLEIICMEHHKLKKEIMLPLNSRPKIPKKLPYFLCQTQIYKLKKIK